MNIGFVIQTFTRTYIHVNMYVYVYAYMYIHMHIHIPPDFLHQRQETTLRDRSLSSVYCAPKAWACFARSASACAVASSLFLQDYLEVQGTYPRALSI